MTPNIDESEVISKRKQKNKEINLTKRIKYQSDSPSRNNRFKNDEFREHSKSNNNDIE